MTREHGSYELEDGLGRIDFPVVHDWLNDSYWSPRITLEKVRKAAENTSLVVGSYSETTQVGYLRVISDRTTFAWIADVVVDERHRGRGLGKAMVQVRDGSSRLSGPSTVGAGYQGRTRRLCLLRF